METLEVWPRDCGRRGNCSTTVSSERGRMDKNFQKERDSLGLVVYTFNLSPGEAEASRSLVNSRPGLHGKFQAIQGCIVRPYI